MSDRPADSDQARDDGIVDALAQLLADAAIRRMQAIDTDADREGRAIQRLSKLTRDCPKPFHMAAPVVVRPTITLAKGAA